MSIEQFYDQFSERQANAGVHRRHVAIFQWLMKFGLQPHHNVLEIGCGIGTVTGLVLDYVKKGRVVANDISGTSIDMAHKRLGKFANVTFLKGDYLDLNIEGKFDVIFLPDVLEHIPLEQHRMMFAKLKQSLSDDGFILIHIPEPHYLSWVTANNPAELQVLDQPVFLGELLKSLAGSGLNVEFLFNYSIWNKVPDYQVIQLKKRDFPIDYSGRLTFSNNLLLRMVHKILKILGIERKIIPL